MKKTLTVISVFLIFSFMLTACGKKDETGKPVLNTQFEEAKMADAIDITALYWAQPDQQVLSDTAAFIKQEYGIDLNISIIRDYDLTGAKTAKLIRETENGGLFFFSFTNLDTIEELAASGDILPINKALENNSTWKALPEGMKQMYNIGDGNIWSVSRSYSQNILGRAFRKDYLNELGLTIPDTLSDLYEVSKSLSQMNDQSIGMLYYNALSFNDIFYANDTPIAQSHTGMNTTSIVYDKSTETFEDSMLKPDMENSLQYIITLIDEKIAVAVGNGRNRGVIPLNIMNSDDRYTNGYGEIPVSFFGDGKYEVTYGITGTNHEYINPLSYNYTNGYYVLSSKTPDADSVINTFISLFYGDEKAYIATSFGAPGDNYSFNGDTLLINSLQFFNSNSFALVADNPLINFNTVDISASGEISLQLEKYKEGILAKDQYIQNGLSTSKMFTLSSEQAYPLVYPSLDDFALSNPAQLLLDNIFTNIFRSFTTPSEGIKEYQQKMKQLGEQEIIDSLNEKIGMKTIYKY
ncbi:MAG: hypothetical protein JXQ23_02820 [Clostridia bacterium]|nr:hypothetical protein [Clostridia bacterium]